jgi:ketosteroid isomerase-like protein
MSQRDADSVRAIYAEWAQGNFRAGGELVADDTWIEPMSDGRESYRGIEAANKQWREFFAQWSEFRIEAQELVEIGDTGAGHRASVRQGQEQRDRDGDDLLRRLDLSRRPRRAPALGLRPRAGARGRRTE